MTAKLLGGFGIFKLVGDLVVVVVPMWFLQKEVLESWRCS